MKSIKVLFLFLICGILFTSLPGKDTVLIFNPLKTDGNFAEIELFNDILGAKLSCTDKIKLVDRNALNKILQEKSLSHSGMLDTGTVNNIGTLLGADHFVSGSIRVRNKNNMIFVKLISVRTGVVKMQYISQKSGNEMEQLADKVIEKIINLLSDNKAVTAKETKQRLLYPEKKRPAVALLLPEIHILRQNIIDPAAENILTKILLEQKFTVKQLPDQLKTGRPGTVAKLFGNRKSLLKSAKGCGADYLIYGEAIAESSGSFGSYQTARARVELKIINVSNGSICFADSAYAGAADTGEIIAGKMAIQKAAAKLAIKVAGYLLTGKN
ncbi:MAG: hypothetical protein IKC05_01215 [Lentisphaeria bacterium]|nr:hypothetical protein [Lentisphaeria bacterium]